MKLSVNIPAGAIDSAGPPCYNAINPGPSARQGFRARFSGANKKQAKEEWS